MIIIKIYAVFLHYTLNINIKNLKHMETPEKQTLEFLNALFTQQFPAQRRSIFFLQSESHFNGTDESGLHSFIYTPIYKTPDNATDEQEAEYFNFIEQEIESVLDTYIPFGYHQIYDNPGRTRIFVNNHEDIITIKSSDYNFFITIQYSGQY